MAKDEIRRTLYFLKDSVKVMLYMRLILLEITSEERLYIIKKQQNNFIIEINI